MLKGDEDSSDDMGSDGTDNINMYIDRTIDSNLFSLSMFSSRTLWVVT